MAAPKMLGLVALLAGCGIVPKGGVDPRDIDERTSSIDECPVHRRPLVIAVEPYVASYISWGPERGVYVAAAKQHFPFAMLDTTSGPSNKTHLRVHYCPECRRAEGAWHEEHDLKPEERELLRRFAEGKSVERAGSEMGLDPGRARRLFGDIVERLGWVQDRASKQDASR